jgi:hypothetical protein
MVFKPCFVFVICLFNRINVSEKFGFIAKLNRMSSDFFHISSLPTNFPHYQLQNQSVNLSQLIHQHIIITQSPLFTSDSSWFCISCGFGYSYDIYSPFTVSDSIYTALKSSWIFIQFSSPNTWQPLIFITVSSFAFSIV